MREFKYSESKLNPPNVKQVGGMIVMRVVPCFGVEKIYNYTGEIKDILVVASDPRSNEMEIYSVYANGRYNKYAPSNRDIYLED